MPASEWTFDTTTLPWPEIVAAFFRTLGQPNSRVGSTFTYCVEGGRTVLEFTADGELDKWKREKPQR